MLFTVLLQKHATSQVYTVKYCSTIPELEGPSTGAQINGWLWSHIQLVTSQLLSVDTFHLTLFTLALQVLVKVQYLCRCGSHGDQTLETCVRVCVYGTICKGMVSSC